MSTVSTIEIFYIKICFIYIKIVFQVVEDPPPPPTSSQPHQQPQTYPPPDPTPTPPVELTNTETLSPVGNKQL